MKKCKIFILISLATLVSGCQSYSLDKLSNAETPISNDDNSSEGEKESTTTYTVLIYMCGSDLESQNSLATKNIEEMCSVDLNSNINLIIETGGASQWDNKYNISPNEIGRYKVNNKKLEKIESKTNANMGETTTLIDFLDWGINKYPADKTSLVFWNHGGAMSGVCADENYKDVLLNSEVSAAFSSVISENKLEWVGYDACLMQVQDIADFNSNYANYMVASQETEPGGGWDYDSWLNTLSNNIDISTSDLLTSISDSYVKKVQDSIDEFINQINAILAEMDEAGTDTYTIEGKTYTRDYLLTLMETYGNNNSTLSVLDLSKMKDYKESFEEMASQIKSSDSSDDLISQLCYGAETYGGEYSNYYKCYDADDILNNVIGLFPNCGAENVLEKLKDLIIYNKVGNAHSESCGLSIHCGNPDSSETNFTNWYSLIN